MNRGAMSDGRFLYLSRANVEAVGLDLKTGGWLQPGAFASAVDFDSYWSPAALAEFDKVTTDDHAQFQYYKTAGYFQHTPDPCADLGEIVAGTNPGRERAGERTLAVNLGLALEDMAVAPEIFRRARERGLGTWLPL